MRLIPILLVTLTGCGSVVTDWPGRTMSLHPPLTIVTTDGMKYPCQYGVEVDGYGYRCYKEPSLAFGKSKVLRLE